MKPFYEMRVHVLIRLKNNYNFKVFYTVIMCNEETLIIPVIIIRDIHAIRRGNDQPNTASEW